MKFFKPMTTKEAENWKRGGILGLAGLIVAFGREITLNLKDKSKPSRNKV